MTAVLAAILLASTVSAQESVYTRIYLDSISGPGNVVSRALTATVGDFDPDAIRPFLELSAWRGECVFRLDLRNEPDAFITHVSMGVQNGRERVEITQSNDIRQAVFVRDDGSLEWEIILDSQPDADILIFNFQSTGLIFHYQGELTHADSLSRRPDSVVGSYAVYHATRRNSRRIINGSDTACENYGTGKAFHIYRPRAWDSRDTVWCDININPQVEELTISLPPSFLNKANYPVFIDPHFGRDEGGASSYTINTNNVRHCRFQMGAVGGTADSIVVQLTEDGAEADIGCAIYSDVSGCSTLLDSSTQQITTTTWSTLWYQTEAAVGPTLNPSTNYYISLGAEAATSMRYDDFNEGTTTGHWSDPWPFESSCSCGWNDNDYSYSIYVVYMEKAGSELTGRRRRIAAQR